MGSFGLSEHMVMKRRTIKLFLRFALAFGFLSASADRFGLWGQEFSVWGNWESFLDYTQLLNPWFNQALIPTVGLLATLAEIGLALCLILGFRTELAAKLSGVLLLVFALSMTFSTGVKGALDYSVFTASAAAFALGHMREKYLELDLLIPRKEIGT